MESFVSPFLADERGLTAATVIDKAVEVNAIGGVYANQKPTAFLSLTLKLLTLQPEREILLEYLRAEEFKWVIRGECSEGGADLREQISTCPRGVLYSPDLPLH